jgi:hypothetical protein
MQIELTSPQEAAMSNKKFQVIIETIEKNLNDPIFTDEGDGWGDRITVFVEVEKWMFTIIEAMYKKLGWSVSNRYSDRLMFMLPKNINKEVGNAAL